MWNAREGVCRDFAHVSLSFPRALDIPARYVFGYLPDLDVPPAAEPTDFAAWSEVWLDGAWHTVDPRDDDHRKGRVLIGRGRDALDVAMVTTYGGPAPESMPVRAEETGVDPTPLPPVRGELVADPGAAPRRAGWTGPCSTRTASTWSGRSR